MTNFMRVGQGNWAGWMPGIQNYGPQRINQINGTGVVSLDGTTVEQNATVNGVLNAKNAVIEGSLSVTGNTSFDFSTIHGTATICGYIKAVSSCFKNQITITSQNADFDRCKINASILVKPTDKPEETQIIRLCNDTIVTGSITFAGNHGEVHLSDQSQVQGGIIGGISKL